MSWQPIETAPEGELFLAYNGFMGVYQTTRFGDEFPCYFGGPTMHGAAWEGRSNKLAVWYPVPSHWMPLPPPPE